ncbi:hypothetical protein ABZ078_16710 [Streptomyces sp. NPDC006385]|uniref:hypothetical protein n=1 Tax=Streptomyces sp. NPDC006385 TaxID=3156761 RepID=UPI0033B24E15
MSRRPGCSSAARESVALGIRPVLVRGSCSAEPRAYAACCPQTAGTVGTVGA